MKNILFVCTGNSCRSVMAEGLFRKMTERKEMFLVGSAGISAADGYEPTSETVRVMEAEGIDVSGHRSRRLTLEMIRAADKILVMEKMHQESVLRLCPEARGKVFLLTEFSPEAAKRPADIDVPDPIRMSDTFYERVLSIIRSCVDGLVERLSAEPR